MDVAVIGAGFSGMLAAYLLEKKGINVTIFEKNESIGGHCSTLISKDVFTDIGTVFSFKYHIKELLIDLDIDYTEQFIYKKFIDDNYSPVEQMSQEEVFSLIKELNILTTVLENYSESLNSINYGVIDKELMIPFSQFIDKHKLYSVAQIIKPYLSSFGFGNMNTVQAYYVLKIFNIQTIKSYLHGEKLLLFKQGTSEIIKKLSRNITDIRYSLEVKNVEVIEDRVRVETTYSSDYFDKVLITTKLPRDVIKDKLYNSLMKKIETNPYLICAYEVDNHDSVSTYYKANLGEKGKIQFFHIIKQNSRTTLVAYAYGTEKKEIIDSITKDIEALGIKIRQLITVKQWYIFPHLKEENLTPTFYKDISDREKDSNICLIGSLVSEPSIDNLYVSVTNSVNQIISNNKYTCN